MLTKTQFDHYIPIRKTEIVSALLSDPSLERAERAGLGELIHWLALLFHIEFFPHSEHLKETYVSLNPDRPGKGRIHSDPAVQQSFLEDLDELMIAANFRPLDDEEIEESAELEGRVRTNIKVQTNLFSEIRFYARGQRVREFEVPKWFGLRDKTIEVLTYDHVVFCMIPSPSAPQKKLKQGKLRAGAAYLHLFRDIPAADLKSLYPNAQAALSIWRKLLLGFTTIITGAPMLLKIIPALSMLLVVTGAYLGITGRVQEDSLKQGIASGTVLAAFIALGFRQWGSYDRYSLRHQKEVSDNALINKMNQNAGCFDYLVSASEDAEVKETVLAYAILAQANKPLTQAELDRRVESWLLEHFEMDIDFEIDDGVAKLQSLSLVETNGDHLTALPIDKAIRNCIDNWRLLSSNVARNGLDEQGLDNLAS